MKVLIVEDEPLNATHLIHLLKKADPTIEVTGICGSVEETTARLKTGPLPDLLFLDIHVSDGLIFDLFDSFHSEIPIIFTTAFSDFALRAFKHNSIDYLLKPIRKEELDAALEKYRRTRLQGSAMLKPLLESLAGKITKAYKERFMVRLGEHIASVKTEEISCFHYEDGLVMLHRKDGKKFPVDFSLDALEDMLNPSVFFRINRKVLANIEYAGNMHVHVNNRIKVTLDKIPDEDRMVSRDKTTEFRRWMDR